jgi:hypothetical protein
MSTQPKFLTVREAETVSGLPSWLLYKAAKEGRLKSYKFRAAIRILCEDLNEFVKGAAQHCHVSAPPSPPPPNP